MISIEENRKLPAEVYEIFFDDFHWKRLNPNLRVGQAFLNNYFPDVNDDCLYYESDPNEALKQIIEKYVKGV